MSKILAIVQARMGSTRLSGKVLMNIVGRPMLWHVLYRIKRVKLIDKIVIATTTRDEDEPITKLADECNVECYRGSAEDVLDRYYQAAKKYKADVIVRITADDPLKDPEITDKIIKFYLDNNYDYVSNTIEPTYPEGIDVEVFSFSALERAWMEAKKKSEREHVTPYIWNRPKKFRIANIKNEQNLSHLRWTVDDKNDLEFIREIYEHLFKEGEIFLIQDVLGFLGRFSDLTKINKDVKRNEGYMKSLKEEDNS